MTSSRDTARSNLLWIADLQDPENKEIGPNMKWNKLINEWGTYWSELTNDGSKFCFYTNAEDSPNYKIVTYDLEKPQDVSFFLSLYTSTDFTSRLLRRY